MPKHLQFSQINNKFQSDVNKKLIVQRSELIVSKKKHSRIEPKQLRKTVMLDHVSSLFFFFNYICFREPFLEHFSSVKYFKWGIRKFPSRERQILTSANRHGISSHDSLISTETADISQIYSMFALHAWLSIDVHVAACNLISDSCTQSDICLCHLLDWTKHGIFSVLALWPHMVH